METVISVRDGLELVRRRTTGPVCGSLGGWSRPSSRPGSSRILGRERNGLHHADGVTRAGRDKRHDKEKYGRAAEGRHGAYLIEADGAADVSFRLSIKLPEKPQYPTVAYGSRAGDIDRGSTAASRLIGTCSTPGSLSPIMLLCCQGHAGFCERVVLSYRVSTRAARLGQACRRARSSSRYIRK
jgi:hypothetical protein